MRVRSLISLLLLLAGFCTFSIIHGQDRIAPVPLPLPSGPDGKAIPEPPTAASLRPAIDPNQLSGTPHQFFLSAQRGAEWLTHMNGVNGRFRNGWVPSLDVPLEGDNYLRQVGAAFALARAARLTGEERYTVVATRALLSLLDETALEANNQIRYTPMPSVVLNRLGSAALLVLAVNELPAPRPDLLEKSEQLCNCIRRQARPDGALSCGDVLADGRFGAEEADAANQFPGLALYALVRSMKLRPAAWKTTLVRTSVAHYLPSWRAHKNLASVPWQMAALAEAYLLTRDPALADTVFEMADWLIGLQYDTGNNNQHPEWVGGFKGMADTRVVENPPTVQSAACGEGLAAACRVARLAGDERRFVRYGESLQGCLLFVFTLQYSETNTRHFVPDTYRDRLAGGFHASTQDGALRLDYTQQAVSAMVLFVELAVAQ